MKMYRATKPVSATCASMSGSLDGLARRLVLDRAAVREAGLGDDLVVPVQVEVPVLDDQLEEIQQILRVQLAGVLGQQRWHVQRCGDGDVADADGLAGLAVLAV